MFVLNVNSQDSEASKLLAKYGFSTSSVLTSLDASKISYSFKANSITSTIQTANNTSTTVKQVYTYDSEKSAGEKFTLISVDGKDPKKKDYKHFDKEKNSVISKGLGLTEKDFFIESDNDKTFIIGFNMPKEELSSKAAFMSHSTGYIYIDKTSGRITKIQIKSNESFSIKVFHVTSMIIDVNFKYNDKFKQYYITSENTKMKVLILGSTADFSLEETYSDFKFN